MNLSRHRLGNLIHSLLLLGGMILLLSLLGWIFAGPTGMQWVFVLSLVGFLLSPHLSPQIILKWYAARPLSPDRFPSLYSVLRELVRRAELPALPTIYHVPSRMLNAFATGSRKNAAIAVTDGLLQSLNMRELTAILAHEVSHLQNNDLWIMNLSDTLSRVTSLLSLTGQFLVVLNLPLLLVSGRHIYWTGILVLVLAPVLTVFLQLALSRTREYRADLGAAALTGDPRGMASALSKIEEYQGGWLARIFFPGHREPHPSILRTHPQTRERIRRLLSLSEDLVQEQPLTDLFSDKGVEVPSRRVRGKPKWRIGGIWY